MIKRILTLFAIVVFFPALFAVADEVYQSPLVGLWKFDPADDADHGFSSYIEFTEDGLYIYQMIDHDNSNRRRIVIDRYSCEGPSITIGQTAQNQYRVDGETLTIRYHRPQAPSASSMYHRVSDRPQELLAVSSNDDWCYSLNENGDAQILRYIGMNGPDAHVAIPSSIHGHAVCTIEADAFRDYQLAAVSIPVHVSIIHGESFESCQIGKTFITSEAIQGNTEGGSRTISPIASDLNPEHLEMTASYARILDFDEERMSLSVELIVPEIYSEADVLMLRTGDSLFINGEEIIIRSIDWYDEDEYLVINAGSYQHAPGSIYLHMDKQGNYVVDRNGHVVYSTLLVLECPVIDALLFLDYTSSETGDATDIPTIYSCAEFLDAFQRGALNLGLDNAIVVFDEAGRLVIIQRFFVPWQ